MSSLSSTALGQTYHFKRYGDKIIVQKFDEANFTMLVNIEMDDFAFSFDGEEITFHNIKDFINCLKIQDYPKVNVDLSRMVYKNTDTVLMKASSSKIYHKLSAKDRYADKYGFDDQVNVEEMDADPAFPKMLTTSLTRDQVKFIYDKASKFKADSISFSRNLDGVSINFFHSAEKQSEYTYDLSIDSIENFENTTITPDTVFSYNFFHILRAVDCDVKLRVYGTNGKGLFAFAGTYLNENVSFNFAASTPSKVV